MSFRTLEQGISVIQQGNLAEGERLIKIALKDQEIQGVVRATALMWLAETTPDPQQKMKHYQEALAADPGNEAAKQHIAHLMASGLPSVPAPQPPQNTPSQGMPPVSPHQMPDANPAASGYPGMAQPVSYTAASAPAGFPGVPKNDTGTFPVTQGTNYRTVGVLNGPNGKGTGFFVTPDGLIATSRSVVGGEEVIHVELEPGKGVRARVVRAFPQSDLVFINTGVQVSQILPVTPKPTITANTFITAFSYPNQIMQGQVRTTRSEVKPEWFPTTIAGVLDAGGGPILDDQNMLIGMLTTNKNRTSDYAYGLNINAIYRLLEQYFQEIRAVGQGIYCPDCGCNSRAGVAGGFYCETCGAVLPAARNITRRLAPQMEAFYTDSRSRPCPQCGSGAGFYNDKCLRCQYDKNERPRP